MQKTRFFSFILYFSYILHLFYLVKGDIENMKIKWIIYQAEEGGYIDPSDKIMDVAI